jgi:hypothetical protein
VIAQAIEDRGWRVVRFGSVESLHDCCAIDVSSSCCSGKREDWALLVLPPPPDEH